MMRANVADIRRALLIVVEKPAPDSIPLSAREKVRKRDYYTAMFEQDVGNRGFLVDAVENHVVRGRWVSRSANPEPATIELIELTTVPLEIRQYLSELEIVYSSPREFVWHHYLHLPRLKLAKELASQWIYARKILLRADRIDILRRLLESDIQERDRISTMEMMNDLHGRRWPVHPQALAIYRYTELLLQSLAKSGDLEEQNGAYRVLPKAIETIVIHEVEDRRHQGNVKLQLWVVGLTLVLAIIGAIQAYAAILQAQ